MYYIRLRFQRVTGKHGGNPRQILLADRYK